jgi:hypothetical protein
MDSKLSSLLLLVREMAVSIAIALLLPLIAVRLTYIITPAPTSTSFLARAEAQKKTAVLGGELRHLKEKEERLVGQAVQTPELTQLIAGTREKIGATEKEIVTVAHTLEQEEAQIDRQQELHARTSLYVSGAFGIGALLIGLLIPIASLGAGFIIGGTLSLLIGYIGAGYLLGNVLGFIALLLALAVLVGVSLIVHRKRSY